MGAFTGNKHKMSHDIPGPLVMGPWPDSCVEEVSGGMRLSLDVCGTRIERWEPTQSEAVGQHLLLLGREIAKVLVKESDKRVDLDSVARQLHVDPNVANTKADLLKILRGESL